MRFGVCYFYSETGTEGGRWAWQNDQFISKDVPKPYCKKCGEWLEPQENESLKIIYVLPEDRALANEKPLECPEGQHEREIGDSWSLEGLHILKDGDFLTIFSPEGIFQVVWSGIISLNQFPPFTEGAFGMWIHADQKGVDRETWAKYFLEEYPAELIPASKP